MDSRVASKRALGLKAQRAMKINRTDMSAKTTAALLSRAVTS